ncbi:MAG: dephospho-CoA kinase [Candidatus Nanopelagicales bacterium]|nr:dephospho-CoA kinase [Candidatus Nanopelagicales bacterium]
MPFVVGLTGGVGSGKSTAASCFKKHGAVVVDADAISRTLTKSGSPVIEEISMTFGAQILHVDGSLNRSALAALVFGDSTALNKLNTIMHPKIRREATRQIETCASDEIVVYDMPLLIETDSVKLCDVVIVVDLDPDEQIERLVKNRGMSPEEARARIRNQASRDQRNLVATWVLDNSKTTSDLQQECASVWLGIVERAVKARS